MPDTRDIDRLAMERADARAEALYQCDHVLKSFRHLFSSDIDWMEIRGAVRDLIGKEYRHD